MNERDWLAHRFEETRPQLRAVAYRMLGSLGEAEDAVQEAWLRLNRADTSGVENLGGWLTTVVGRVCLDMLRSRRSRREEPLGAQVHEPVAGREDESDPEHDALMAESVGQALLVVLDRLTPAERVAFVLHDMFDLPFDEIAPIVGRSPTASRQLASRARRRVRGASAPSEADLARRREIVAAFLAAARGGDFDALLAALDPDAVIRSDEAAAQLGAAREIRGARTIAGFLSGRAQAAQLALIDGAAGAILISGGRPQIVFAFSFRGERIAGIDGIADPERLRGMKLVVLEER